MYEISRCVISFSDDGCRSNANVLNPLPTGQQKPFNRRDIIICILIINRERVNRVDRSIRFAVR